jgi:triosephosphate isomerase
MGKIIAANWKMNFTNKSVKTFFDQIEPMIKKNNNKAVFCVPFTTLATVAKIGKKMEFGVGAQNFHPAKNGTYTGETSLDMIAETGATYLLAGHSERRTILKESDEFINEKVKAGLAAGFRVIFCCGESAEEREAGKTMAVLKRQITKGLKDISVFNGLIVAYEPIWAISGGDPTKPKPTPTSDDIREIHAYIKSLVPQCPILYGGSANDKNADEIFAIENVDGALVGGASLVPEKFASMINGKY